MLKFEKPITEIDNSKKFVFCTSSYNQCQFINKNLESIKMQNYSKDMYRIIYVNDASTDNSLEYIEDFIKQNEDINIKLINNDKNMGPAYSRFIAYNLCEDNEICVFLDGDDWLIENNTLGILSYVYKNNDIYATFGSMQGHKYQSLAWKKYERKKSIKVNHPHLRTAYAFICKNIPERYLKYKNQEWFIFCTDRALFGAICELCGDKYAFIKNEFVYYNQFNCNKNKERGYNYHKSDLQALKRKQYYWWIIKKLEPLNKIV